MNDRADAASIANSLSPKNNRGAPPNSLGPRLTTLGRDYVKDVLGGLVASVVLIANIVSFGALMFQGELSVGIPIAIWAMLIGGCVCGTWIAITTSLPPIATGIDSPTGAVLVLLSAATGASVMKTGGTPQDAVQTVMLAFTGATLATGVMFYALGACRWGSYFRFVPYFAVGGFLTATGCFLIAGAMRMITGQRSLAPYDLIAGWTMTSSAKLTCAAATFAALLLLRRYVKSPFALPAALIAMWLSGIWVLHSLGLSDPEKGWYFHSLGTLTSWFPFEAARKSHFTLSMLPTLIPEIAAVTIVSLISLVTKVSSIEITRQTAGDLDRELRSHGFASISQPHAAALRAACKSRQAGSANRSVQRGPAGSYPP
jgi:SulP family sulfate permease